MTETSASDRFASYVTIEGQITVNHILRFQKQTIHSLMFIGLKILIKTVSSFPTYQSHKN